MMETNASKRLRIKLLRTVAHSSGSTINGLIDSLLADIQSVPHLVTPSGSAILEVHQSDWFETEYTLREYRVYTEAPDEEED